MSYESLKKRQQNERDGYPPNLGLRVHRSLSWLHRAEQAEDDDGKFIFLWIAFNAAYACEISESQRLSTQETFTHFLDKLCNLDSKKRLNALLWQEFSGSIRVLLDNPYVFQSFWEFHSGKIPEDTWKERFKAGKLRAKKALESNNPRDLLSIVLSRLYTLRNQLIHGGATWNSTVNREQVRDCVNFMSKLVPLIIELMMDNPQTLWGDACYPVVEHA